MIWLGKYLVSFLSGAMIFTTIAAVGILVVSGVIYLNAGLGIKPNDPWANVFSILGMIASAISVVYVFAHWNGAS